jgi:hypothetical protein
MDDALREAVLLFNHGRFVEFQDALEGVSTATRAASERQFYVCLSGLAEGLRQLGNGDLAKAEVSLAGALRKLEPFLPRFRGIGVQALVDDLRKAIGEIQSLRAEGRKQFDPRFLPRLRVMPE